MSNPCIKTGARVLITDYGASAPADLFLVGGALLVHFPDPWDKCKTYEDQRPKTGWRVADTHVRLGHGSLWRPDLGIALVPVNCAEWRGGAPCPWREEEGGFGRLQSAAHELADALTGDELDGLRSYCEERLAQIAADKYAHG